MISRGPFQLQKSRDSVIILSSLKEKKERMLFYVR